MKNRFSIITLFVLLQLGVAVPTFAVSEASVLFLLISPSPQANGRGGVYIGNDDPMSPIFNPAFLGIMAQKNFFIAGFYPNKVSWLPGLASDVYIPVRPTISASISATSITTCPSVLVWGTTK